MPTEDFAGWRQRYENELEALADAAIDDRDREAIRRYVRDRDGDLAVSSLASYCNMLRVLAEYSDVALVDLDIEAIRDLFFDLRRDTDMGQGGDPPSDATVYNYQAALSAWGAHRDADWYEAFDPDKPDTSEKTVDPGDMLSQEDIGQLVATATRPRNQALIEFFADTGARLTMAGSLRVGDVDLDGDRATYTPNADALGLKGAEIKPYPIIDAKASLRTYLRHSHPRPDVDEAALFHKFENFGDDVAADDGSLSPSGVRDILDDIAAEAGVDKPTNPHNFRHSAITRMWREGYDRQEIQHRVQWSLDTDMWQRYVHVTAEEMNEEVFAAAGVVDDEDSLSRTRDQCGTCRETLPPHAEWCPQCGAPVSPEAREERNEAVTALVEGQADIADLSRRKFRTQIARRLNQLEGHDSSPSSPSTESNNS